MNPQWDATSYPPRYGTCECGRSLEALEYEVGSRRGGLVGTDGRWDAMSGPRWKQLLGCDLACTRGGVGRSLGVGSR